MDSKQCIVAAHDGFLERKSKILMVATFGALHCSESLLLPLLRPFKADIPSAQLDVRF